MVEESQAALAWLKEKQELQARLGAHEDPVLVSADIKKKEDTLRRVADPILSEKPPPPPKVCLRSRKRDCSRVHHVLVVHVFAICDGQSV